MPYEDSIQHLLSLFLEYKQTSSRDEKIRLEMEILQLFDTLGASLAPEMISVRGEFERMLKEPIEAPSPAKQLRAEATRFARERVSTATKGRDVVKLTWGARQLLNIPLIETYETVEFRNAERADQSLRLVVQALREDPRTPSEGHGQFRTSIAVIRAFAKNFCNIPPFCAGK